MSAVPGAFGVFPGGAHAASRSRAADSGAGDSASDPFAALFAEIRAAGLVPGANGVEALRAVTEPEQKPQAAETPAAPSPFDAIVAMLAGLVTAGGPESFAPRVAADAPARDEGARAIGDARNPKAGDAGPLPAAAGLRAEPANPLAAARDFALPAENCRAPETDLAQPAARSEAPAHAGIHALAAHAKAVEPSVPTPAPVTVPMHDPRWGAEVAERVQWIASQDLEEARIQVTPPELGPIDVRIAIDEGRATIHLAAQVEQTRATLESHLHGLAESLSQSGLTLAGAFVSQENPREQRGEAHLGEGSEGRTEEAAAVSAPQRLRLGLVDDFV